MGKFIKLTDKEGDVVFIESSRIKLIGTAKSVTHVDYGNPAGTIAVRETPEEVMRLLEEN